jgi:poly(3-hydroxybutyrate) depolymerase
MIGRAAGAVFAVGVLASGAFASTGGSRGAQGNVINEAFTASNGLTSRYHLFAEGLPAGRPVGLLVQFHGDGAFEFNDPASSYSLGGRDGIVAKAAEHHLLVIAALSPDRQGSVTWWEEGSSNADYVRDLIQQVAFDRYDIDTSNIWLVGYSGGAQFITQFFLPKHSSLIGGGGSIAFAGGGRPRVTPAPFSASIKANVAMHWFTGADDDGRNGSYDALSDARLGFQWYRDSGFTTTQEHPAGLGHGLSGRFGTIVDQQLDRHVGPTATPPPPPGSIATVPLIVKPAVASERAVRISQFERTGT